MIRLLAFAVILLVLGVVRIIVPTYDVHTEKYLPVRGFAGARSACTDALPTDVSWYYRYSANVGTCTGVETVPMVWWFDVGDEVSGSSTWVLGTNEPNAGQYAITPQQGATYWREMEASYPDRLLVAPVPTQDSTWLVEMRTAYIANYGHPPRFDALAVHTYRASATDAIADVHVYLDWADAWGVGEVWITEFNFTLASAWQHELLAFRAWVERKPAVTRYAYFVNRVGAWCDTWHCAHPLVDGGGLLTQYGQAYVQPVYAYDLMPVYGVAYP